MSTIEKVNNDKYFSRWYCSKNDGSVFIFDNSEFELYKNITTGKITQGGTAIYGLYRYVPL